MKYFLDTNVCIYFLKGLYPKLRDALPARHTDDIKIPSVVKAELLYGVEKSREKAKNDEAVRKFLLPFEVVNFGDKEAEVYAEIRAGLEKKGNVIGPNDLIVAATTRANGGVLVTNNTKEFSRVKTLKIEDWTR